MPGRLVPAEPTLTPGPRRPDPPASPHRTAPGLLRAGRYPAGSTGAADRRGDPTVAHEFLSDDWMEAVKAIRDKHADEAGAESRTRSR